MTKTTSRSQTAFSSAAWVPYGTQVTRLDGKRILARSLLSSPDALHSDILKNNFYFFIQNWTYIFICLYLFSVPKLKRNIMLIFTVCVAVIDQYLFVYNIASSEHLMQAPDWSRQLRALSVLAWEWVRIPKPHTYHYSLQVPITPATQNTSPSSGLLWYMMCVHTYINYKSKS